tara:strand:- start:6835 stop:7311 length:477 start_codon:yes stop_codon:yes gene_type:complete
MAKGADATKKNGKKKIPKKEYDRRFREALVSDYTPKEIAADLDRKSKNPFYLAKDLFVDAPRDVIGPKIKREGILGAIPGYGGRGGLSPEARAKEIRTATRERLAREKKNKAKQEKNRARAKANPSLLKGGVNYKGGGKVTIARGSGAARPQNFRKNG